MAFGALSRAVDPDGWLWATPDAQSVDALVQLTARVIEVNADFFGPRGAARVRGGGRGAGGSVQRAVRSWVIRLLAGGFELTDALDVEPQQVILI